MNKISEQAEILFKQHKIKAAMPLFEKVIDKEPKNIKARYKFGVCLYRLKEFSNAERVFRDIVSTHNSHYEAWYYLGLSLEKQNDVKNSVMAYKICLAVNPSFNAAKKKTKELDIEHHASLDTKQTLNESQNLSDDGPGREVYSILRRRMGSFTRHVILIVIVLLLALLLVMFFPDPKEELIYLYAAIFSIVIIVDMFFRSITTKTIIYERRIEFMHGILFKKHQSLWIFEIKNLSFHRNPWFLITRNATIKIDSEKGNFELTGLAIPKNVKQLASVQFSQMLFDSLRNIVRNQRGEIKKVWI